MVKNPPAMRETQVQSLGQEDPLEEGMVTHSSIVAWRIPRTEEPGGLQSTGPHATGQPDNNVRRCSFSISWAGGIKIFDTEENPTAGVRSKLAHPLCSLAHLIGYVCAFSRSQEASEAPLGQVGYRSFRFGHVGKYRNSRGSCVSMEAPRPIRHLPFLLRTKKCKGKSQQDLKPRRAMTSRLCDAGRGAGSEALPPRGHTPLPGASQEGLPRAEAGSAPGASQEGLPRVASGSSVSCRWKFRLASRWGHHLRGGLPWGCV